MYEGLHKTKIILIEIMREKVATTPTVENMIVSHLNFFFFLAFVAETSE